MEIVIVENLEEEMKKDLKAMKKGTAKTTKKIVMTPETFTKVFSPQRIRLLMAIRKHDVESISDLARILERKFEAVHRDIKYLTGIGLITVIKENNKTIPTIDQEIKIPAIV